MSAYCVLLLSFLSITHATSPYQNEISTFNQWITTLVDKEHLAIEPHYYGPQLGIGAIAVRDLSFGDVYASLPPSAIISEATARARTGLSDVCDDIDVLDIRQSAMDCILLFLALERRQGDSSFWAPYIALLPPNFNHLPALFDRDDIEELQGSHARTFVERAKIVFVEKFEAFSKLQKQHPSVFQPKMTVEEYAWAVGVVATRTIWYIEEGDTLYKPHLVPLVDTVNCAQLERANAVHRTYVEDGHVVTRVQQDFAVGEQVFENYGKPNLFFFWMHGFSIEPNEFDCVIIPLSGEATDTLCLSLRSLPGILEKYGGYGNAVEELIAVIIDHLSRYSTTLEQDEEILGNIVDEDVHASRKYATVSFRMTEKRMLGAVLKKLYELKHLHYEL
jgi:hypothetical protein